ncbi:alpha-hydroxy acid oxidase [Lentzea albida]|uniref:4-hydroxymandelate oxidase n=1 Tax=Lentzea albida TaxID=65499 RepID=A0A1H9C0U3_9PSEU|nr:alpha-hydroxy acid oxidase [Lentzea albida]SEP94789.1 4-hydroxymandelate oxidase [Lentzea albida]
MTTTAASAVCLADLATAARSVTPDDVWDFVEGGSGAELSLVANRAALDDVYLVPRVLRDVSRPHASRVLLGTSTTMPVVVAPMAYQRLLHPDGELAAARAARSAGIPFTVPMLSSVAVEEVARSEADLWFQLYWLRDRAMTVDLLARAEAAGCRAIVLTVDVPLMGRRLRDLRNGFTLPRDVVAAHFPDAAATTQLQRAGTSAVAEHTRDAFDPSLSWSDIDWLRSATELPIVLKGLLAPQDAARAARTGVDAVVVSNHGGRQLDGALPGIRALPAVRDAVDDSCDVLLDGGIRSGVDVVKALALGASGVLVGRPVLHGLALDGTRGVEDALALLRAELDHALALAGCRDLGDAAGLATTTGTRGPGW